MRITLTSVLILFAISFSFAQVPGIKWQKAFGGSWLEEVGAYDTASPTHAKVMMPIKSGGYLIAGSTSLSTDGDISGNHGGLDIWVARLDSSRNIIWKNCYGGSGEDGLWSIEQVGDEGFILSGTTTSNNGNVSGNHGVHDIWVVRLDMSGSIVWQKCFGGSSEDFGSYIQPTSDGGFILTGKTSSTNGDVSGLHGNYDIWIAKLTSSGTLSWQKCFGGSSEDAGYIIKEIGDNYILGAETISNDGDIIGLHGALRKDIWVTLLDNIGTPLWKRTLGGSQEEELGDVEPTNDGGFIIAGGTSSNDGDVSGLHVYGDGWIVKLNSAGGLQWQRCLGGSDGEAFSDIQSLTDGSYIAIGNTNSTNGDVSNSMGYFDTWVVKVDNTGILEWSKCIGGSNIDLGAAIFAAGANSYITLSTTYSNDKDVSGNHGYSDFWLVYLSSVNTIKGALFLDQNSNSVKDSGEPYFSEAVVTSKSSSDSISSIPYNGLFVNNVDIGIYTTTVRLNRPYYTIVPPSSSSNFITYFNTDSLSFALQPIPNIRDLQISLVRGLPARPGFNTTYTIIYKNAGTQSENGEVLFKPDSHLTLVASSPSYTSVVGDTLRWSFSNLQPLSTGIIELRYQVPTPPSVNLGDTLTSIALITPIIGDAFPLDDTSLSKQRVVASFDPNDKAENNGGIIGSDYITQGKYLNYTIRFQNTGTDTAFNVIVRDTLDSKLDWSTFEMVTASHPYTVSITNQNKIEWTFPDINLPDSNINEPLSHGYLSYRVKPKSTALVGDVINNLASIYFDYNLPVATNNAITLVQDNFSALPVQLISFTGQLNNNAVQLQWKVSDAKNFERFEVERSLDGRNYSRIQTVAFTNSIADYHAQDILSILQSNQIFYRLKLVDADGKFSYSKVIVFRTNPSQNNFIVYPNPARTELFVSLSADKKQNLSIKILDASGRALLNQEREIQKGNNVFPVNTTQLKAGSYLLQIVVDGESKVLRFAIMN